VLVIVGIVALVGHDGRPLRRLPAGSTVQAGSGGFGVYSSQGTGGRPACQATSTGGQRVALLAPSGVTSITKNGRTFTEIARTPDAFPAGRYTVSCTGTTGVLATGDRDFGAAALGIVALVIGAIVLVIAGTVLVVLILVLRIRNRRASTSVVGSLYGPPDRSPPYQDKQPPPGASFRS